MNKLVVKHKVKGEDVPVTTSLRVAEIFDKRHDNVVRDIEKLIDDMKPDTSDLRSQMFTLSTYKNRGKDYKQYLLTFDGFSLLVMGFTGAKAMKFKLAYIKAFNEMKKELEDFRFQRKLSENFD